MSTLSLETKQFWEDFSALSVDTMELLFSGRKGDKGEPTLRITVPEHIALIEQLKGLQFSYLRDEKPHSRGAALSMVLWMTFLSRIPHLHPDGTLYSVIDKK